MSDVDTEALDGWTIVDGDGPAYPLALQLKLSVDAEREAHGPCLEMRFIQTKISDLLPPVLFTCNRGGEHLGRHLAVADQGTGAPVVAAWPGTYVPVLTDMIGQPDLTGDADR